MKDYYDSNHATDKTEKYGVEKSESNESSCMCESNICPRYSQYLAVAIQSVEKLRKFLKGYFVKVASDHIK